MTTLDPREDVQSRIEGARVARMIIEFHAALRDTYGAGVMTSDLCAVGPLQSMIGLAIKNGHLALPQPVEVTEEPPAGEILRLPYTNWNGVHSLRKVIPYPTAPWFGSTEWHPERQWFLKVWDVEREAARDYAIAGIGATRPSGDGIRAGRAEVIEE